MMIKSSKRMMIGRRYLWSSPKVLIVPKNKMNKPPSMNPVPIHSCKGFFPEGKRTPSPTEMSPAIAVMTK